MVNKKGITDFKETDEVRHLYFSGQQRAHRGFIHTYCTGITQNVIEFRYKTTEQTFNKYRYGISCTGVPYTWLAVRLMGRYLFP
jgi:hypothetical protein